MIDSSIAEDLIRKKKNRTKKNRTCAHGPAARTRGEGRRYHIGIRSLTLKRRRDNGSWTHSCTRFSKRFRSPNGFVTSDAAKSNFDRSFQFSRVATFRDRVSYQPSAADDDDTRFLRAAQLFTRARCSVRTVCSVRGGEPENTTRRSGRGQPCFAEPYPKPVSRVRRTARFRPAVTVV